MKIFLIRHGKSDAHEENRRQSPASPLGQEGIRQAHAASRRMAKEQIDVILSSKWDRAKQTASIISQKLEIPIELFEGIHEKEQNPSLYGVEMTSKIQARYQKESDNAQDNLDWKFEGQGESMRELIKRAADFMNHLKKHHKRHTVLAVSHGLFIRSVVILALLGEKYDEKSFAKIFRSMTISNTSVTLLEYDPRRNHWELRYLNDHLHIK